ncbi:MAG: glycosyltransferase family 2 protein [Oscillospiraceae bacterium]|nr:glycosyltransferase family 2 protein [Oscillospiraceae bacterium]
MDEIQISVIVPMYNSESTIIPVLEAICAQTKKEYIKEIIVVNDGSTDNSPKLVSDFMEKSPIEIVFINKPNGGLSSARNAAMRMATGNWFALDDSDDPWLEDKIEIQVETIKKHPEIDFLGGRHGPIYILFKKIDKLHKATIKEYSITSLAYPSTVIFRRLIYDEIGGFDESRRIVEDGYYFTLICAKYNFFVLPIKTINYGGNDKRGFGISGLSGNLKGMHEGNIRNIREFKQIGLISPLFYIFLRIFYRLKYIRRILITKFSKK